MKMTSINNHDDIRQHMLMLATDRGIEIIDVNTILRIEAISNYSKIFFSNNKTLVVARVLRWFEENLPADLFIRIHRTHIVNRNFVQQFMQGKTTVLQMQSGERFVVSRRKRMYVVQHWHNAAA